MALCLWFDQIPALFHSGEGFKIYPSPLEFQVILINSSKKRSFVPIMIHVNSMLVFSQRGPKKSVRFFVMKVRRERFKK